MSDFDPAPENREDGGTDYKISSCPNVCYWMDHEGAYVGQCPCLVVNATGPISCEIGCKD